MTEGFAITPGVLGELFWKTGDAVLVARQGRIIAMNAAAQRLFDLPAQEMEVDGKELSEFFGVAAGQFLRLVRHGGLETLWCRGGSGLALRTEAWTLGDSNHPPMVILVRDVTDERRRQLWSERLNVLSRRLVSDENVDALLQRIVDEAKDLASAAFSALLVLEEDSLTAVRHFVYNAPRELFPDRLPRVIGLLAVPINTRTPARLIDIRNHPAGVGIPVEHPPIAALLAVPILKGNDVIGELAVANEPGQRSFDELDEAILTELAAHTAIALSLASARAAQAEAEAARRALTDVALHNIRTPLAVAKGSTMMLRDHLDQLDGARRDEIIVSLERALERVQSLAEGALTEAPFVEGHDRPPTWSDFEVEALVKEVLTDFEPTRGDVELIYKAEPDCPRTFRADTRFLREALDNLVANALAHSPAGGTVTVTCRREGDALRLDVTDHGPGISAADQSRLFRRPVGPGRSSLAGVTGSGQGLWIVRRLLETQGGTVGVTSRPGQGSTFWISVPLVS